MLGRKKKKNLEVVDRIKAQFDEQEDEQEDEPEEFEEEEEFEEPKPKRKVLRKQTAIWDAVQVPTQSITIIKNNKTGEELDIYQALVEILNRTE